MGKRGNEPMEISKCVNLRYTNVYIFAFAHLLICTFTHLHGSPGNPPAAVFRE
jgi:hypothetical protein